MPMTSAEAARLKALETWKVAHDAAHVASPLHGHSVPAPTPGYLVIGAAELASRPTTGAAWDALNAAATGPWPVPDLCNQDNRHAAYVLAAAIKFARTGDAAAGQRARDGISAAMATQRDGCANAVLSLGRQLPAYIVAADLVRLDDAMFRAKLADLRFRVIGGHPIWTSLAFTMADSSNNWGSFAHAAVIAIDRYLGNSFTDAWTKFRGRMGDLTAYTFRKPPVNASWWGETTWRPVQTTGDNRSGAVTEDAWRSGDYPTISNTYVMDSAGANALSAEILQRAGYPAWDLLRHPAKFLMAWPSVWTTSGGRGGRALAPWYNARLGIGAPTTNTGDRVGWLHAWTDWLYG